MGPGLRRFAYPRRQPYVGRPFAPWLGLGCGLGMKRVGAEGYGAWRAMPARRGRGPLPFACWAPCPSRWKGLRAFAGSMKTGLGNRRPGALAALSVTPGGEVARYDYGRGRCRRAPRVATVRARLALPPGRQLGRVEGAALRHLGAFRGWHWENRFPAWVLYLSAADLVFAPSPGAFTHPQQMAPHDLFTEGFYPARAEALEARCAALASGAFDLSAAQKLWHRFGGHRQCPGAPPAAQLRPVAGHGGPCPSPGALGGPGGLVAPGALALSPRLPRSHPAVQER